MDNIFENLNEDIDLSYSINKEYKIEKYIIKKITPIINKAIKYNIINRSNINDLYEGIIRELNFHFKHSFSSLNKDHRDHLLDILIAKFFKK